MNDRSTKRLASRLGALITVMTLSANTGNAEPIPNTQELQKRIVAGIKANYARLETVQATIESTTLDPSVTERVVQTFETKDGARITAVREPRVVRRSRLLIRQEALRSEPVEDAEGHIWSFHQGVWTQYVPSIRTAWRRRPDQMPGMFAIDPRDFGARDIGQRLAEQLGADILHEAAAIESTEGESLVRCVFESQWDRFKGHRYRCDLDPARNHLPVAIAYLHEDGSINVSIEIAYQKALPGSAWFPCKATTKIFGQKAAQSHDAPGWMGMVVIEIKEPLVVNRPLADDAIEIELPAGALVRDAVNTSVHQVGVEPGPDEDGHTQVGDPVPDFELTLLDGKPIRAVDLKGKPVLLTFFATWCGPCLAELPRLEREIWQRFQSKGLVVLAVGREHTTEELVEFNRERQFTFLLAADPERKLYSTLAAKKIPRTYVLSRDGKIVYQSVGYSTPIFERLVAAVEQELTENHDGEKCNGKACRD